MQYAIVDGEMRHIDRALEVDTLVNRSTLFLFGPRQTGKSTYLRHALGEKVDFGWNLLDQALLRRVTADPTLLRQQLAARDFTDGLVSIDEIQKCPALLDEIHFLIEQHGVRFVLTGSSARSLRRRGVNLLGGRGRDRKMHPFTWFELTQARENWSLPQVFHRGLLPPHWFSDDPEDDLDSYVGRYLTEEIGAESIARNLGAFGRFLETAALCNSQEVNYSNIASDAGIPRQTVTQWFGVLADTLLGAELPAFARTRKRKAVARAKFYFFDLGIVRALRGFPQISEGSSDFGQFFEHLIYMELSAWISYRMPRATLHYWRSRSGFEVDFVLDGHIAIEVKAAKQVSARDLKGLKALREERICDRYYLVCRESTPRRLEGIDVLPYEEFFRRLWNADLG